MAIKNVVVVVDDFSDATLRLWSEGYGIEIFDYGVHEYSIDYYDANMNWQSNYASGAEYYYGALYLKDPNGTNGFYSAWDYNINFDFSDEREFYAWDQPGYYVDSYYNLVDPFYQGGWQHGDIVAKAFFEQLDDPTSTYILAIDWDPDSRLLVSAPAGIQDDLSFLVGGPLDADGQTPLEQIVDIYLNRKSSLWPENEFNLIGYSFSFTSTVLGDYADALFPLYDGDSPIFSFSQNNVSDPNDLYFPSWNELFADIITVGAWNTDSGDISLIADKSVLDQTDILADGIIDHGGADVMSLSGDLSFGTSFATPRIMAEVVNYYEEFVYPLLTNGTIDNIAGAWGQLVDPSTGYSGIVDHILDAISTTVEILFEGATDYVPFRVMTDNISVDALGDLSWPQILNANASGLNTDKILDVRLAASENAYQVYAAGEFVPNVENPDAELPQLWVSGQIAQGVAADLQVEVVIWKDAMEVSRQTIDVSAAAMDSMGYFQASLSADSLLSAAGNYSVSIENVWVNDSAAGETPNYVAADLMPADSELSNVLIGDDASDRESFTYNMASGANVYMAGGDDIVQGSDYSDIIHGGDGNDALYSGLGLDFISGGSGDDHIFMGLGGGYVLGGSGNDQIYVSHSSLTQFMAAGTELVSVAQGLTGDGASVFVMSAGRKFDGAIPVDPSLSGMVDQSILNEATARFTLNVEIPGYAEAVPLVVGPGSLFDGPVTMQGPGFELQFFVVPQALLQGVDASDPSTSLVDLVVMAFDSSGSRVPLPAGVGITLSSVEVGYLASDGMGGFTVNDPQMPILEQGAYQTFYTETPVDKFAYDNGAASKIHYKNTGGNVTHEMAYENTSVEGGNGIDTVHFNYSQSDYVSEAISDGTWYQHTPSGHMTFVSNDVENVIFHGISEPLNPTNIFALQEFSVFVSADDSDAHIRIAGTVDLEKLSADANAIFAVVYVQNYFNGSSVDSSYINIAIPISEINADGTFAIDQANPGILQGSVELVSLNSGASSSAPLTTQYFSGQTASYGQTPPMGSSANIAVDDIQIVFDEEAGEPQLVVIGHVDNPSAFAWGSVGLRIGMSGGVSFSLTPDDIQGGEFRYVIDNDQLTGLLQTMEQNGGLPLPAAPEDAGRAPIVVELDYIEVIDTAKASTDQVDFASPPATEFTYIYGDLVDMNYVNLDGSYSGAGGMPIIYSSAGDDSFGTQIFSDALDGVVIGAGDGDDRIRGSYGDDSLYGGAGNDFFLSSSGLNKMFGGANDDYFSITEIPGGIANLATNTGAITGVVSWINDGGNLAGQMSLVIADPGPIDEQGLSFSVTVTHLQSDVPLLATGNIGPTGGVLQINVVEGQPPLLIVLAVSESFTSRASADGFMSFDALIVPSALGSLPEGLEVRLDDITVNGNTISLTHGAAPSFVLPNVEDVSADTGYLSQFLYDAPDAIYPANNSNEIDGGTGKDTVRYFAPRGAYEVTTENGITTVVHIASGRIDTLTHIETIEFIDGANVEVITLDPFSDYQKIDGGEGDDFILGGAGKSYIVSGGGSDIIRDEGGEDYVVLTGASGTVDVDLGIGDDIIRIAGDFSGSVALSGGQGNDVLEIEGGFEGLIRDGFDLVISLGAGNELRIADQFDANGNVNADTGIGLIRNVYVAEDGSETVSAIALDPVFGEQADYTQIILTADNPYHNEEWNSERWNPLNIIGHDGDDFVDAGEGNDLIIGNGGDDLLFGLGGDDVIRGGEGDDLIGGDAGTDMLFGGSGDDIYSITFYKDGFYSSYGPDDYGNIAGWTPGGLDTVEDESGFDTLLLEGYLLSDPLGDVKYELSDGALQISVAVEDVAGDLAITEMVRWNWFRFDAHYEEGEASYGMTYSELEAFDLKNIETWPGWNDLDAGSQAFYRQYLDPTLPVDEFLAHINNVAGHVYQNVSYNRYTIDPVAYDGNYPLYTTEEFANAAREGDGTSQVIYIEDMATGTPVAYYMPNGVANAFFGDLPDDYDFGADDYGVNYTEGYLPQAPMSGDPAMGLENQMPFLFATSLANGNLVDMMEADMAGAKQGVVVDDASTIERIIEVADEGVFEFVDAKIDEIMAGGGAPEAKIVDPTMWVNSKWASQELASGVYGNTYFSYFSVRETADGQVILEATFGGVPYLFWKGPKENVTHFSFRDTSIDVAQVLGWEQEEVSLTFSQAVKEVIPWAIEEGYFKEYFLDPNGVALGSDQDQMLIADWGNLNAEAVYRYVDEDGIIRFSENAVDGGELFVAPAGQNYLSLFGGEGDDKLIAADDPTFPPTGDPSWVPSIQILHGGAGEDMFVNNGNGIVAMVGNTGIDRFYIGEGISQNFIYGDDQAVDGDGVIGVNTDFGDAAYFDWAFAQEEITRNTDGSIVIRHLGQQVTLYDVEYMFFRDENGDYERYAVTEGEIIGRDAWTNATLKAQYDTLDPSNFSFAVDFNTQVSGITTDRLILKYNDEEVWSGDRWSVDKLELPQGVMVNVVNVKATDALTGDVFDPNDFTTDGIDLIFGDDRVNIIDAKGGNDVIFGGGGDDVLIGGDGDDMIFGQEGDDIIRGDGVGVDDVAAGYFEADYFDPAEILAGNDLLEGGAGIDDLAGGADRDALAADSFSNVDIDGDGDTADTLADIAGFNPFEDPEDIV